MAGSPAARPKAFRRAHLWVASLIALVLGAAAASFVGFTDAGASLELAVSDTLRAACALPDSDEWLPAVTVEVDDRTIEKVGRWPWPRPVQAEFLDAIAALGPRLIVLDIEYSEAEEACVGHRPTADGGLEAYVVADPDARLRESIRRAGNVIIAFSLSIPHRRARDDGPVPAPAPALPPVLKRHALDLAPDAAGPLLAARRFSPMIPELGDVALGAGYANVVPDVDNAVRQVPLVARGGERVLPHLALEVAGQARFGSDYRVRVAGGRLILSSADARESVRVPVDAQAQINFRWPTSLAAMKRLPAHALLGLVEARRTLENHRVRWRRVMEELAEVFEEPAWPQARRDLDEALAGLPAPGGEARAQDDAADRRLQERIAGLRRQLKEAEDRLAWELLAYENRPAPGEPQSAEARRAAAAASYLPFLREFDAREKDLIGEAERAADRLRPHVADRLCLVGVNATGISDQHRTPISPVQPGVTVYPAVVRTILSGVAFRRLPAWQEWLVAVLAAWLAAVLTSRLASGWGVAAAVNLSAATFALAYLASWSGALLLPVAGPGLAVIVAFAGVSAYRQLTESSSRRWITGVFKQYVSADHVEEILRRPDRLRLGGERCQITVLFSDIAGFTPLSESLAPERLVALLNRYLSAMTDVLLAEGATLDKYEGDGILAFVGAPVAAPDHTLRGVRAALGMQAALARVNEELHATGLLPDDRLLAMRIGCSTGPAIVGNFGSERRFDYTAMGDTVNLGRRLEEANRQIGTSILVAEATRAGCGGAVLFRPLGPARIRGKTELVRLYEPLAPDPAPQDLCRLAQAFGRAVEALARGDLAASEAALAEALALRPEDGPAKALWARLETIKSGRAPAAEPWWDLTGPE